MQGKYLDGLERPNARLRLHRQSMAVGLTTTLAAAGGLGVIAYRYMQSESIPYTPLIVGLFSLQLMQGFFAMQSYWSLPANGHHRSRGVDHEPSSLGQAASSGLQKVQSATKKVTSRSSHHSKTPRRSSSSRAIQRRKPKGEAQKSKGSSGYFPPEVSFKTSAKHPLPPKPAPVV